MVKVKAQIENGIEITDEHIRLAHIYAGQLSRRFKVPLDEAISSAYTALMDAKRLYDPARGASFETFLISKIKWQSFHEWRLSIGQGTRGNLLGSRVFLELDSVHLTYESMPEKLLDAKRAVENLFREKPIASGRHKQLKNRNWRIWKASLRGETNLAIAKRLGLSRPHVCRVLKEVRQLKKQIMEDL